MSKKRIFKRSLAIELIERGHKLLNVEENKNNPNYLVYTFESTINLHEDMFKISNR